MMLGESGIDRYWREEREREEAAERAFGSEWAKFEEDIEIECWASLQWKWKREP